MTTLSKQAVTKFHQEACKLLTDLAKQHGLKATKLRSSYTENGVKFSAQCDVMTAGVTSTADTDGPQVRREEAEAMKLHMTLSGIKNKEAMFQGEKMTLVGYRRRSPKYPWILSDGKKLTSWTESTVLRMFGSVE